MKRLSLLIAVIATGFMFMNFNYSQEEEKKVVSSRFTVPDEVQQIILNHCYDCHYSHSKNLKGKTKLKFDAFDKYKKSKVIAKLQDIADVMDEGKMPPKRAVRKYPQLKLTEKDAKILYDWANAAMDEVMQ